MASAVRTNNSEYTAIFSNVSVCPRPMSGNASSPSVPSPSAVTAIIQTMDDYMSQGVDIQLKFLQILLSLITNSPPCMVDYLQMCVLQFHFRAVPLLLYLVPMDADGC